MNLKSFSSTHGHHFFSAKHVINNHKADKKSHFEINDLEWMEQNFLLQREEEARVKHFEILWFTSGAGCLKVNATCHPVKNNTAYCLAPGQVRNYLLGENPKGFRISFSTDFLFLAGNQTRFASWLDSYSSSAEIPVIEADHEIQGEIEAIFKTMRKEYGNYFLLRAEILSGLLNILLIHLSRRMPMNSTGIYINKEKELVYNFKELVKQYFVSKKLVAHYASELCVTPNYLNKTIKKVTGFTASYHIQQQIILEAKRHAIHSNGSMKEIAYFLGFDNLAHFSKFFKNNSGINFTSFKKGVVLS